MKHRQAECNVSPLFPQQLRTALDKNEEMEMTNNHLVKRLEKMKANRNALLSQQWGNAASPQKPLNSHLRPLTAILRLEHISIFSCNTLRFVANQKHFKKLVAQVKNWTVSFIFLTGLVLSGKPPVFLEEWLRHLTNKTIKLPGDTSEEISLVTT